MGFPLTPRTMTLDDLELLLDQILLEFRDISRVSEATTAKRMKIDPYCQRRYCSPTKCTFQRCIDCVDIARRSSARGRQTTARHTHTAVARLPGVSYSFLVIIVSLRSNITLSYVLFLLRGPLTVINNILLSFPLIFVFTVISHNYGKKDRQPGHMHLKFYYNRMPIVDICFYCVIFVYNYPRKPHVVAAIWPYTYLLT